MKKYLKYPFIILCICAFGLFVSPGLYKYDKLNQKYPVKINRLTGKTTILYTNGVWETATSNEEDLKQFEEYKQQVIDKLDQQKDSIKQEVLTSIYDELSDIKEKQASIDTRPGNEPAEPLAVTVQEPDTGTFTKGDTLKNVEKVMGTPDAVSKAGPYETWTYGFSTISFKDGKVEGWNNLSDNLRLK